MIRRCALALALLLVLPVPAVAHKLRVFAAVDGSAITGYAFFVGGGRPQDVPVTFAAADGTVLQEGRTDAEGGFFWVPPEPADYTVTVNAQDGHAAVAQIPATRFGGPNPAPAIPAATPSPPSPESPVEPRIEDRIAAAVQREILPLREQIEAMDSRLRVTDILSGIFLILGVAGAWLWVRGRQG